MTVFLDSTALLGRHFEGVEGDLVSRVLQSDSDWCVSAVALTECQMLARRVDLDDEQTRRLHAAITSEWNMFHVVPVDDQCLERASEIGRSQPLRTIDAIQLAGADRLPRPLTYVTFDPNQIGPAILLGFEVISTLTSR